MFGRDSTKVLEVQQALISLTQEITALRRKTGKPPLLRRIFPEKELRSRRGFFCAQKLTAAGKSRFPALYYCTENRHFARAPGCHRKGETPDEHSPFIAALCGVLLLTACTPAAPETVGEPASEDSQISSEPLEVVCDDPDAPPELTAEAEDKRCRC